MSRRSQSVKRFKYTYLVEDAVKMPPYFSFMRSRTAAACGGVLDTRDREGTREISGSRPPRDLYMRSWPISHSSREESNRSLRNQHETTKLTN